MMMMMMMMVHMFANLYKYSTYVCIFTDIEISNKKTLFQDVIRKGVKSQVPFTGSPFVILGTKCLDCKHEVDLNSSKKKNTYKAKSKRLLWYFRFNYDSN